MSSFSFSGKSFPIGRRAEKDSARVAGREAGLCKHAVLDTTAGSHAHQGLVQKQAVLTKPTPRAPWPAIFFCGESAAVLIHYEYGVTRGQPVKRD
jgi:hypothetical protein